MSLGAIIKNAINEDPESSISFHQFMELALYHPMYGYYSKKEEKVGKEGDFYTNASVGSVFGEVLAGIFSEMMDTTPGDSPFHLIEFGGGKGELMHQILGDWKHHDPDRLSKVRIVMVDRSPYHQEVQKKKLEEFPVIWVDQFEEFLLNVEKFRGVVFSNELIDAFPVHLAEWRSGKWWEVRVSWDPLTNEFKEVIGEICEEAVRTYLRNEQTFIPPIEGYRVEVNLGGLNWIEAISNAMTDGYVVTIDYGFARPDLYIPERRKGTIMCYKNHQAFEDPLVNPGSMDITSHVNFSTLIEAGEKKGLDSLGLFSQSEFLINGGILEKLMNHQETDPFTGTASKRNRSIRQLIMPDGMGQTFKVLVQVKGKSSKELNKITKKPWTL